MLLFSLVLFDELVGDSALPVSDLAEVGVEEGVDGLFGERLFFLVEEGVNVGLVLAIKLFDEVLPQGRFCDDVLERCFPEADGGILGQC